MAALFNLPSNILSEIYKMDPTYRDKFSKEINQEIFRKSFDRFRERYIKSEIFRYEPQIAADKFDVLLKFVFDNHLSQYENGEYDKPLLPDEITIFTYWNEPGSWNEHNKENENEEEGLYVRLVSSQIFEGNVYTIAQYDKLLNELINDENVYGAEELKNDIVFRNDTFIICRSPFDNDFTDTESMFDDDYQFNYDHNSEI